ncbi:ATP-dependent DNA helicase RecG [Azospirillaceae bacterium]
MAEKLAGPHVVDLLWHLPSGLIDRRFSPKIAEAPNGRIVTLTVTVDSHVPPVQNGRPYRVRCVDGTGLLELVFFHAREDYLSRILPIGAQMVVSGKIDRFYDTPQMPHPDWILPVEDRAELELMEPVYPLTAGMPPKTLRRAIRQAVKIAPVLPEWLDAALVRQRGWPDWRSAVVSVHDPNDPAGLEPSDSARQRLAYDEILASQIALALVRTQQRRVSGRSLNGDGRLRRALEAILSYRLTNAQRRSVDEIIADMASDQRMLRLLQGDVGSGKTIVALLAMLNAVECGFQAALMVPTEILARQHLETVTALTASLGVEVAMLTGRDKGKTRAARLERLAAGEIALLVGTHAIFQDDVVFQDLGLVVIDEQHRFGVDQRLRLSGKGASADILVMTATPIPRTLTLTIYGDMSQSRLDEKPPGRKPVTTLAMPVERIEEVVGAVARKLAQGARVYWVCPLVDESMMVDLAAATERYALLREYFGDCVGLVHGRMRTSDKDAVMAAFVEGKVTVLVATTVIEVGVNVPEATIMVIEHAERFGLAQLHQLRGRIGRGVEASSCLLLYARPLSETARARIKIMKESEDGFLIAEEDLKLRGAGDLLGTRQSGLPGFRLADLTQHDVLLEMAQDDARLILNRDPDLMSERGDALRILLYLFERDSAIRYLQSG